MASLVGDDLAARHEGQRPSEVEGLLLAVLGAP